MRLVVDAQLIAGYFREAERGEAPAYTGPVTDLIQRLGRQDRAFLDETGRIEQEYRDVVDPEWFEAWLGDRLANGDFVIVAAQACPELIRLLITKFGFPRKGGDRHYVALARAIVEAKQEPVALLSEDLDFYDPKAKQGSSKRRAKLLNTCGGPVARYLTKHESICVRPVAVHLAST
jgi:hypothetical protein